MERIEYDSSVVDGKRPEFEAYAAFERELIEDLIPHIEANYSVGILSSTDSTCGAAS